MFLVLLAIQVCLVLYTDQTPSETDLWSFAMNMDNWNTLQFIGTLAAIAGGVGLVGITAASIFGFKTDFLIFAIAIPGIIYMGSVIVNLGNVIRDELVSRVFIGCGLSCPQANFVLAIVLAPLALIYVWSVVEWWRGKDF